MLVAAVQPLPCVDRPVIRDGLSQPSVVRISDAAQRGPRQTLLGGTGGHAAIPMRRPTAWRTWSRLGLR